MNQRKKYNLILLIIIPILALCLLGMVASIYQNITAADDVFTINGSNSNYTTTGGNTITVTRTVNKRNLPSCDIIYWNENGATVIKNVDCSSGQATQNVTYIKAIVVPHYDYNVFVTSEYELRTLNNDWLYNENNGGIVDKKGENDLVIRSGFANVYVLQDITLSNDLTLNFPFYMDLLNARITGNVTVEHNYAGDFRIDGTFGGAITNLASLVSKGTLYYKETKQEYDNFSVSPPRWIT